MQKPLIGLWVFLFSVNSWSGETLKLKGMSARIVSAENLIQTTSQIPHYYVVQFKNNIQEKYKNILESFQVEIKGYLPEDALIVKGTEKDLRSVIPFLPELRAFSPLKAEWKMDSSLQSPMLFHAHRGRTLIHIRIFDESEGLEIAHHLDRLPEVTVRGQSGKTILAETSQYGLTQISQTEGIEWLQPLPLMVLFDYPMESDLDVPPPNAPPALTGYESGGKLIGLEESWARGFNGKGQIAAMADTGVDMGEVGRLHKDLSQVFKGYPMGMLNTSWSDPMGHGTHVAGSVIGNGAATEFAGDKKIRGGAHGAKFIAEGMWNSAFNNLIVESDFEKLMGTPYRDGARIHTNSWGSPLNPGAYDNFAAMADEVTWNHPDLLVLFAAGNDGQDGNKDGRIDEGSMATPATAKNILTVGASENLLTVGGIQKNLCDLKDGKRKWGTEPLCSDKLSNHANGLAAFSSRGPTQDGRTKPDVVAPGTNIVSVRSQHPSAQKLWGEYNSDYLYCGGTSMATPVAAGAATVARQFLIDHRKIANPSSALVKALLIHTAKDLFPGQYGVGPKQELPKVRPNGHEGYGLLDMDALTQLGDETVVVDNNSGLALNEEAVLEVALAESKKSLRVTLVYTDKPATTNAAVALVNDLDLKITKPNGEVVTLNDHINNVEMLELSTLPMGNYKISVVGKNVPMGKNGKQPYALLVSQLP